MRKLILSALLLCSSSLMIAGEVESVAHVDINRYMGKWYEIASYPQWFSKDMRHISATYTLKDGYVEVYNSGFQRGKIKDIKGKAFAVKGSGNSQLKVTFFWPFYGKYWIIALAEDYSWAVVSEPKRSTLWILSRSQRMDEALYLSIVDKLRQNGFDTSKLVVTNID